MPTTTFNKCVGHDDRQNITAGVTANEWHTEDMTAYGVPAGAAGAILEFTTSSGSTSNLCGVRHPDSSGNYRNYIYTNSHVWLIAPLDASGNAEIWRSSALSVYVHGYIAADGGVTLTERVTKSMTDEYTWEDIDCSAQAPGAVALIFEAETSYPNAGTIGYRKKGSTDTYTGSLRYHMGFIVACDSNQICQIYRQSSVSVYLIGYITESDDTQFNMLTNWSNKTPPTTNETEMDCSDVSVVNSTWFFVCTPSANTLVSGRPDSDYGFDYKVASGPEALYTPCAVLRSFLARRAGGAIYYEGCAAEPPTGPGITSVDGIVGIASVDNISWGGLATIDGVG